MKKMIKINCYCERVKRAQQSTVGFSQWIATLPTVARNDGKRGFTLAEVLITLVIIGVIAAITIPNLMQSYKKHQVEVGVKEAYSILSNAIKMAEVENGIDRTQMITSTGVGNWGNINYFLNNYFLPNIKYNKVCQAFASCSIPYNNYWTSAYNIPKIILANGMFVTIGMSGNTIIFSVDINGPVKGKNADGYDTFYFIINTSNREKFLTGNPYSSTANQCNNNYKRNCSSVIMKNGWKIPADYPVKKF